MHGTNEFAFCHLKLARKKTVMAIVDVHRSGNVRAKINRKMIVLDVSATLVADAIRFRLKTQVFQ